MKTRFSILYFTGFILCCSIILQSNRQDNISPINFLKDSFSLEKKMQILAELDATANQLWNSKKSKTLKKSFTNTLPGLPLLVLDDRNNDGRADEFSYLSEEKNKRSQEFGFFFDLNNDGKTDYLIYNGGPLFTKDFSKMFWMNYHLVDANGDGNIDIFVYNGVNIRGENFYDEGITSWLYDLDYDGRFDKAEYLGNNFQQPIEKTEGKFLVKSAMGETTFDEKKDLTLWSHVLEDIDEALKK